MFVSKTCVYHRQTGLAYLAVLFLVVAISISMLTVTQNEETHIRREKERDWLFIGQQYQKAITRYYKESPNGLRELPLAIEDLVLDKRYIEVKRHLRQAYKDPLTGGNWIEIRNPEGRLIGVKSASLAPVFLTQAVSVIAGGQVLTHSDLIFEFKQENELNNTEPKQQTDGQPT